MQQIYVLRCKHNKYYVGKTANIDRRLAEHFSGEGGSEWTALHAPREIVEVLGMTSDYDEMNKTLEFMRKYGIENVRGAQWSNTHLTSEQENAIMAALNPGACFHCQQHGHVSSNCPNRNRSIQCFRCGQNGHFANECNNGYNAMQCERCGRNSHTERSCYAFTDIDGDILGCARCGRDNHAADECYARTDIDGRRLY